MEMAQAMVELRTSEHDNEHSVSIKSENLLNRFISMIFPRTNYSVHPHHHHHHNEEDGWRHHVSPELIAYFKKF
jgi:hypothetical protein